MIKYLLLILFSASTVFGAADRYLDAYSFTFREASPGTNKIQIIPPSLSADYVLTLPTTDGASGEVLSTNGSGVLSWAAAGSGDVIGTSSSISGEVALFGSTTGKALNRATGTGWAKLTSGVLSVSSGISLASDVSGTLPVANGGTGATTLTLNNLLLGNGTSAVQFVAPGTSGNILQSNGTTWSSTALTFSGDVNGPASSVDSEIAIYSGTSGKTLKRASGTGFVRSSSGVMQISSAISLASDVSGILPVNSGGTSASSFAANGVLLGNGSSAFQTVAPGSSGNILTSNGTTWTSVAAGAGTGDVVGPASSVSGAIATFQGTTGKAIHQSALTGIAALSSGVLSTSATVSLPAGGTGANITASNGGLAMSTASAISIGPVGSSGQIPRSGGAGSYTWSTATYPATAGTSGNILTSDGTNFVSTTPAASGYTGFRNRFINGNQGIDQIREGASVTITAAAALAYVTDQWYAYSTGANVTFQRVAGTGADQYNAQFTGAGSVTGIGFCQRIEARDTYDMNNASATITLRTSNSLLTSVGWQIWRATTTADTFGSLAAPTVTSIDSGTFTVTSSMANYSATVSIPSAATTGLQVCFTVGAQTSGTWKIANAQLEAGSTATAFEKRPYQSELLLAQRFLPLFRASAANATYPFVGMAATTGAVSGVFPFPVPTRVATTGAVVSASGDFKIVRPSTGSITCSGVTAGSGGTTSAIVQWTVTGATVDQTYILNSVNAGYIYFTGAQL